MHVERWPIHGKGRSRTVAYGNLVWTVANATDAEASFEVQVAQSLEMLEAHLKDAGSARTHLGRSEQAQILSPGAGRICDRR